MPCRHTLKRQRVKCLIDGSSPGHKLLLLDEGVAAGGVAELPAAVQTGIATAGFDVVEHVLQLGYADMLYDDILRVRSRSSCVVNRNL